jgi:hypothetical protein
MIIIASSVDRLQYNIGEDNIRMDLRETRWGRMYWIDLAQDREQWRALVNMIMNLQVP